MASSNTLIVYVLENMNMKYRKGILLEVLSSYKCYQVFLSTSCILIGINFESTFCQGHLIQVGIILSMYFERFLPLVDREESKFSSPRVSGMKDKTACLKFGPSTPPMR